MTDQILPKCPVCHCEQHFCSDIRKMPPGYEEIFYSCYCGENFFLVLPTDDFEERFYKIKQWNDHYSPDWW